MTRVVLFLIVLALSEVVESEYIALDSTAEILRSVQGVFHPGCVFLIFPVEEQEQNIRLRIVQLEKILATKNILTSTVNMGSLSKAPQNLRCHRNLPLYVLLSSDSSFRKHLEQVSNNTTLSTGFWLLFPGTNFLLNKFFLNINIPFDCEFLVVQQENDNVIILTEVYRVSSTLPLQTYRFGNWTSRHGFRWCRLQFYERRNNLNGYVIKAGYKYGNKINLNELEGNKADLSNGAKIYFSKVWLLLEKLINFTTEYHQPPDNSWGALMKNGSWNGIMGMILRKEIDAAVDGFLITPSRINVINFMSPLLPTRSRPFIRRPDTVEKNWTDFMKPFSTRLWVAVILAMFLLSSFLSSSYYLGLRYCGEDLQRSASYGLLASLFYVLGSFCQQGHNVTPSSASSRTVYVTSYLVGVILLAAYSASLISHLTDQRVVLPFTTFQSLLNDGSYKLGVIDRSAQLNYFDNSTNKLLQRVYTTLILPHKQDLPLTEDEGLTRVCDEHKYAFMTPFDTPLSKYSKTKCTMMEIPMASFPGSLTMPIAKKHPFLGLINHSLENLRRVGILKKLYTRAWPRRKESFRNPWTSVNIEEVSPIFSFFIVGIIIAVFVLVLEYVTLRLKSR